MTSQSHRSFRDTGSSMSSLSDGLGVYNAGEPKPLASANNSVRSKASFAPGPAPQRPGGSVARSYQSKQQPRSVNNNSAQSVSSALSNASMTHASGSPGDDDTMRLVGLANELTQAHNMSADDLQRERERSKAVEEERFRLQEEIRQNLESDGNDHGSRGSGSDGSGSRGSRRSMDPDDDRSRLLSRSSQSHSKSGRSRTSQTRHSRRSIDPDEASRSRGGVPPPPPRSVRSSGSSRRGNGSHYEDPDGMSRDYGADDPDGRQYAPGSVRSGGRGDRSVPPPPVVLEEESIAHTSVGSQSYSQRSQVRSVANSRRSGVSRNYYDDDADRQRGQAFRDEEEDESYYSRGNNSGMQSRGQSTARSGGPAPPPPLSMEASAFSGGNNSVVSRDSYAGSRGTRSYASGSVKKASPLPIKHSGNENKRAMWWYNFSRCITLPVADKCIKNPDPEAKQAWREKVAICFCVFMVSGFFVGIFGFIPIVLCRETEIYTMPDVNSRIKEDWIALHGYVYDVGSLFDRHPTGPAGVEAFLNDDASRLFPRMPAALLPPMCLNQAKVDDNVQLQSTAPVCDDMGAEDIENSLKCHHFSTGIGATSKYMGEFETGILAHDGVKLRESKYTFWVSIHDRVYNVTKYVNNIRNVQTKQIEPDHELAYLEPTLNNLIINKLNEDATELFVSVYPDDRILGCMDELFYVGIIDTRFDVVCFVLNIIMYFLLIFVALMMVAQMICSLMYIAKNTRTYSEEDTQDQVVIMVPCYNEGGNELIKTIDSVMNTTYPEENKVLLVVADGVVTGAGSDMSTPEHLAEILGFDIDMENDELHAYDSIGLITSNNARVYHGYFEADEKSLKYVVVVKAGLPMEQTGSAKPGNRGKRDSQLIVMGYFNRIYHGRELNELDAAIEDAMIDLNMQSDDMRLLMTIDADTRVDPMSITHMAYNLNKDEKVIALCGETKVDNKMQSLTTMIQVFEYYNNHHMKKAFESAFGCVTCLPGCFSMYRILNDDGKPLLANDNVYAEYLRNDIDSLHEQNLYHLGEDRMLTTLLLHFFPDMRLTYVPEAICHTIVPHTMRILMSQRRRWINSTYHNLLELTKVKTMCGICCCSMKTVVWLDLIACMILPASTVYAVYLIVLVAIGKTQFSILLLVLYGMIIGVQLIVFILRSRYDFILWFIIFTVLGVPVFYFLLPLYAFWHMDDFSWGETRKVASMQKGFQSPPPPKKDDDDSDDEREIM